MGTREQGQQPSLNRTLRQALRRFVRARKGVGENDNETVNEAVRGTPKGIWDRKEQPDPKNIRVKVGDKVRGRPNERQKRKRLGRRGRRCPRRDSLCLSSSPRVGLSAASGQEGGVQRERGCQQGHCPPPKPKGRGRCSTSTDSSRQSGTWSSGRGIQWLKETRSKLKEDMGEQYEVELKAYHKSRKEVKINK